MLRNEMWKIFKATGNIHAYLYYKDSLKINAKEKVQKQEKMLQGM